MHLPPLVSLTPLLAWFVVGLVIGIVATLLARGPDDQGLFGHVVVGIVAALGAGLWLAPRLGLPVGRPVAFLLGALGLSLFGAVAGAVITQSLRRRPQPVVRVEPR